jgi:hypothetical protein
MKMLILTVASLVAGCVCAFSQGKVNFVNDSLHLVYFDPFSVKAGDDVLRGQPVPTNPTPSGTTFTAGLYAGTSPTALTLRGTAGFTSPGRFGPTIVTLSDVPAPNSAFFQVAVWDASFANPLSAQSAASYYTFSQIFTANTSFIAPNSIVEHSFPVNSTWADGFYNMDYYSLGARGALDIAYVPEPETLALAVLGVMMFWMWRGRSGGR